jgi:hypothetical protein
MLKKYRDPILPTMIRPKQKKTFYYSLMTFIMIIYDSINSYIIYPVLYTSFRTYKVIRNSIDSNIKKKIINGAAISNISDKTFSCGHTEAEHIVLRHNHEKMKVY